MPAALSKFNKGDKCEICSTEKEIINHHHFSSGYTPGTTDKPKENNYINLILGDSLTNGMGEHEFKSEIGIESFGGADYERMYKVVKKIYGNHGTKMNVIIMLGINFIKQETKNLNSYEIVGEIGNIKRKAMEQITKLIKFFKELNEENKIYIAKIPAVPEIYYLKEQMNGHYREDHPKKKVKILIQQINLAIDYVNKDAGFKGNLKVDQIAIENDRYNLQAFRERDILKKCHYNKEYEKRMYLEVDKFLLAQKEQKDIQSTIPDSTKRQNKPTSETNQEQLGKLPQFPTQTLTVQECLTEQLEERNEKQQAEKIETSLRTNLPQMKHVGTQTKETILDENKGWFPQIYCNIL